jgi:hypothetical protein
MAKIVDQQSKTVKSKNAVAQVPEGVESLPVSAAHADKPNQVPRNAVNRKKPEEDLEEQQVLSDAAPADDSHQLADTDAPMPEEPILLAAANPTSYSTVSDQQPAQGEEDDDRRGAAIWWFGGGLAAAGIGIALATGGSDSDPVIPPPGDGTVSVVVERNGAFIDSDGDGVYDGEASTVADFGIGGNADLVNMDVTIQFNDVPFSPINLTGFGTDDKIEFDVAELQGHGIINPGHTRLSASGTGGGLSLSVSHSVQFKFSAPSGSFNYTATDFTFLQNNPNWASASHYVLVASEMYSSQSVSSGGSYGGHYVTHALMATWSDAGNALNAASHIIPDYNGTNTATVVDQVNAGNYAAAHGGVVDFIWPTEEPPASVIHVVVESGGAFLDGDGDGVYEGEASADFGVDGNADLAANQVIIQFNNIPDNPLDLTGFDTDDLLEFDVGALIVNGVLRTSDWAGLTGISPVDSQMIFSFSSRRIAFSAQSGPTPGHANFISDGSRSLAFWNDTGNALHSNFFGNLIPDYATVPSTNATAVVSNINAGDYAATYGGVVDFIWPDTPPVPS